MKEISFEKNDTVKKSMEFYKAYFARLDNAYKSKRRIEEGLKSKKVTGKSKIDQRKAIKKLKNFATEYGLDPNAIGCSK